jgi:hypothetical protein
MVNQRLQNKIAQYKRTAKSHRSASVSNGPSPVRADGLAKVIRSKKDADTFMAELNSAVKRAGK